MLAIFSELFARFPLSRPSHLFDVSASQRLRKSHQEPRRYQQRADLLR